MRALLIASSLALVACVHVDHRLTSATLAFDDARYDATLVWLADLDDDVGHMSRESAARYYYLRGMSAYRLDRRDDALYDLSLVRELVLTHGSTPQGVDLALVTRTLEELVPTVATWRAREASSPLPIRSN